MKKKLFVIFLSITLSLLSTACIATAEKTPVRAAFLKGPTGMGAASLMHQNELGDAQNAYTFDIQGAPDAILAQLITGELDIAALPTNTIALLFQKTEGEVQALAVNTLGVLYLVERGDTVHSLDDIDGKAIIAAARGSTVEAVADHLLSAATVEYASEHAEAVVRAVSGDFDLALLPEPFVTQLLQKDASFRVALDITAAWEASGAGTLAMGGIAVRRAFLEEHPKAVEAFLSEYAQSIAYANENPAEAAAWIEQYDIMPAAVAEKAIPRANMVLLTGDAMRDALDGYLQALLSVHADLIGGALPGEGFYAAP